MKNLFIYIHPSKWFDRDYNTKSMVQTQIDNSLEFGDRKDILFATNFPFSYHGVDSVVVPDEMFCHFDAKSSKVNTVIYLLEQGLLQEDVWLHDLDAFQLHPFDLTLEKDLGLTSYEWKAQWNTGSIFFKPTALDVFKWLRERIYIMGKNEEPALLSLTASNYENINSRWQKVNVTYNLGMREIDYLVSLADKPVKVVHFPPHWGGLMEQYKPILTERFTNLVHEKFASLH